MFAEACAKAMQYTRPMITTTLHVDGTINCGFSAFVMINRDGWAMTAAHCVHTLHQLTLDSEKIREAELYNTTHTEDKKQLDPKWLRAQSIWWGNNIKIEKQIIVIPELDLAFVKLVNLPPNFVTDYPVFKDPEKIHPGMSICRFGYPFMKASAKFDPAKNEFSLEGLEPDLLRQGFPYDGIMARERVRLFTMPNGTVSRTGPAGIEARFIETTTAGLKGQSGGPIFDVKGNLVGLQSFTSNYPLEFGDTQVDGKYMPEQFMHLGWGIHVRSLMAAMDKFEIKYKSESDDDGYRIVA